MKRILASKPTVVRLATAADREQIYRLRHDVYAGELGQHATNGEGRLSDALDEFNVYLVASRNGDIAGFVSITPPEGGRFSVDKYVRRQDFSAFCEEPAAVETRAEARRQGCGNQWPDGEHPRPRGVRLLRGPAALRTVRQAGKRRKSEAKQNLCGGFENPPS
jgi:hypothetical protein